MKQDDTSHGLHHLVHYLVIFYIIVYVTHMKFRVVSGIFTVLSYIGQCDLHNTCFGLPRVWYIPGRQHV